MTLHQFTDHLSAGLFHKPLPLSDTHLQLLQAIFPRQDLTRVRYRLALPWFMFRLKKGIKAITLPTTYGIRGVRIYFRDFNPYDPFDIGLLVHEVVHVKQAQHVWGGLGLGLFRPFVIRYLAEHFRTGYRHNPLEMDAYDVEEKFETYIRQIRRLHPDDDKKFLAEAVRQLPTDLVEPEGHHPRGSATPYKIAGFLAALGAAIGKPIAEVILVLVLGILWFSITLTSPFTQKRS